MINLPREEALKKWQEYWDLMEHEFFKVETLQHYIGENENIPGLSEYLNDEPEKGLPLLKDYASNVKSDWTLKLQARHLNKPDLDFTRIHVVEEPYHPYLLFEIEHYKLVNIPLNGEKVSLVDTQNVSPEVMEVGDFMMFDQKYVANSNYTPNGRLIGMTFYEEGEDISQFLRIREELKAKAKEL